MPVPDIDRTDLLLMLGADPFASNGSLATAPDWPGRLDALMARGGTLVVVDPGARARPAAAGGSNTRGKPRFGRELRLPRHASGVRGRGETMGELPAVVLAEEMG